MSDRELLIHAVQHLEDLSERVALLEGMPAVVGEVRATVLRLDHELSVFAPLLARFRPGGGGSMLDAMQLRREARRAARDG